MFGIKKTGRQQAAKLHKIIGENVAPLVVRFSNNMRIKGRKRLFRRWGRNNPKKVVSMYAVFVVVVFGWNLMSIIGIMRSDYAKAQDPLRLSEITAASNPFEGMTVINRNREYIKEVVSDLATSQVRLAHRFDSLCNLKVKTRQDSLEIVRIYQSIINKTDNNNEP